VTSFQKNFALIPNHLAPISAKHRSRTQYSEIGIYHKELNRLQPADRYSPDPTLSPIQHHVLSLLAQGSSITAAAATVEIHRNTVANWRRSVPAFAREFEYAGRERALFWQDQAASLAQKAIDVLTDILNDSTAAPSLRLRAAFKVLSMATVPKPEPVKPFPTDAAESEALFGQLVQQQAEDCAPAPEIVHNPAQSRTNQPSRNSLCPCKSGLKYKRCCANRTPIPPSPAAAPC
jgi:hypothetical protein